MTGLLEDDDGDMYVLVVGHLQDNKLMRWEVPDPSYFEQAVITVLQRISNQLAEVLRLLTNGKP